MDTQPYLRPAGFWIRVAAHIIDTLILCVPFAVLYFMLSDHDSRHSFRGITTPIVMLYMTLFLSARWQATPGKRLLGVYVGRTGTGARISVLRSFARYLVLSGPGLILALMVIVADPGLHSALSPEQKEEMPVLKEKLRTGQLTPQERARFLKESLLSTDPLSPGEQSRLDPILAHMRATGTLTLEEKQASTKLALEHIFTPIRMIYFGVLLLDLIYLLVIAFMIGLSREKAGPHDRICGTRVVCGRPEDISAHA